MGFTMKGAGATARPKLLFVITEDWYFMSHRLPLALGALEAGMDVAIATNVGEHGDAIRKLGIEVHPWKLSRGSTGIWSEMQALAGLWKIFRRVRPDIVHQVAIKPVLYGSLVAKLTGVGSVVNALGGMGSLFSQRAGGRRSVLRSLVLGGFRWLLSRPGSLLILQNPDDAELLQQSARIDPASIRLIRGAGVDVSEFAVTAEPQGLPLVVLPARMLADKGVNEFVEAARQLRARGVAARFALVGGTDECNPESIAPGQLERWVAEGVVEWFGRRNDMPAVLASSTLVCLPSYREGLPKSLLEAASCGRAIVATDVPGCREIVRHGKNGLLVPARDAGALADALGTLLADPALRQAMGARGRSMVLAEFSEQVVLRQTLDIYGALLPQMKFVTAAERRALDPAPLATGGAQRRH